MATTGDLLSEGPLTGPSDGTAADRAVSADRPRFSRLTAIAPFIAALLAPVWVYRGPLFSGRLPGSTMDARWTIAVHEHWFAVWQGRESIRDMQYFFPTPNTLGTSDAFFVQGQFYSLARLFGVGFVNSWVIAQFLFFVLGSIGLAVLSRQVLASWWAQVAFVGLTCVSYPIFASLDHVQMLGFLSASWLFVGLHALCSGTHPRIGLALVVVVPPLLALSSWYAVVLLAFILAPLTFFLVLFSRPGIAGRYRRVTRDAATAVGWPFSAVMLAAFVVLWASVLWIYLPGSHLLAPPAWTEVMIYGPQFSDIVNASGGGGGLWSPLYAAVWPKPTPGGNEHWLGFTPVLLLTFLVVGLLLIRSAILRRPEPAATGRARRAGLIAVWFTVICSVGLFLMDGRGLSVYRLFWTYIPGLQSVRAPFRIQVYEYALAFFFVLRAIEYRLLRPHRVWSGRRRAVAAAGTAVLILLIAAEMQRPADPGWREAQVLPPELAAQVESAQRSCDAVIVLKENPRLPDVFNRIDGVMFSVLSGLPTPQGYSRGNPVGYPGDADPRALADWMRQHGYTGRVCGVSSKGVDVIA